MEDSNCRLSAFLFGKIEYRAAAGPPDCADSRQSTVASAPGAGGIAFSHMLVGYPGGSRAINWASNPLGSPASVVLGAVVRDVDGRSRAVDVFLDVVAVGPSALSDLVSMNVPTAPSTR